MYLILMDIHKNKKVEVNLSNAKGWIGLGASILVASIAPLRRFDIRDRVFCHNCDRLVCCFCLVVKFVGDRLVTAQSIASDKPGTPTTANQSG
ncbi:MAG: hypothetical protein F6J86_39245 [Symploca sp. SIO1B1]|nr:hypothetical protein [Symploca sp. SIO1B1]